MRIYPGLKPRAESYNPFGISSRNCDDSPFRRNNVVEDDDEYDNEPGRGQAISLEPIARAIHRTEDPSVLGPTTGISLVGRNRCHVEFSRIWRAP